MPEQKQAEEIGSIAERSEQIWNNIRAAAARSGRDGQAVEVIAVSKTVDVTRIREAYAAGFRHFGENRVQELLPKMEALADLDITWHMIGQLQSNKAKDVVGRVACIHSLDRLSLAEELQKQAERWQQERHIETLRCFVEVNIGGEEAKAGVAPSNLEAFLDELQRFPALELVGLMTVAPVNTDPEVTRAYFRQMAHLRDTVRAKQRVNAPMRWLSMGMTGDYPVAVEEGADYLRIGSALFGARRISV